MLKLKVSATALGKSPCIRNLMWTIRDGYKEEFMPAKMVYGIAVHKFVDVMYKTGNVASAFSAAKKAFDLPKLDDRKSLHLSDQKHMITTCANLWNDFIQSDYNFEVVVIDGVPLTEQTFSMDSFYEDEFVSIDIQGTLDKIGKFKGGCYAIGDWKTTSAWDTKSYFTRYDLARQLFIYRLAMLHASKTNPESTLGRIGKSNMGCFIDAIFLKPDANDNKVIRSDVDYKTATDMQRFEAELKFQCKLISYRLQRAATEHPDYLPKEGIVNGTCESKWGLCSFWNVCVADDAVAKVLLSRDFIQKPFNPLDYNELG